MALTTDEIEQLRRHLGFGNLDVGAYPYSPDGFFELFTNVIQPYLHDGLETSATTAIPSSGSLPAIVTVTPVAMSAIVSSAGQSWTSSIIAGARLIVDVDDDAELVVVKSVTGSTFTAKFQKAHDASGYPVAVEAGVSTCRYLIHRATRVKEQITSALPTALAGIRSADKGEVIYAAGRSPVLKDLQDQYDAIVLELGRLIRVAPLSTGASTATGGGGRMEVY